ncbi:hypothetical protein AX14_006946 [Amanita brunnescens Koide BX004]|nr:hypothetical protein AX14_006946 [Amanita brunnescens Koide BX004]
MKFFSTAAVLGFLITMSNVAVAVPVGSSSGSAPARLAKRQDDPLNGLVIVGPLINDFLDTVHGVGAPAV